MAPAESSSLELDLSSPGAGSFSSWPPLRTLQESYDYLTNPEHDLHYLIKECQREADSGDIEKAKDLLSRVEQEVEQEESMLRAAFMLFKPAGVDWLGESEVLAMMQYLHFPQAKADVDALISAVDTDGDRKVSLPEFQHYVGQMGGSFRLFEVRRQEMADKAGDSAGLGVRSMHSSMEDASKGAARRRVFDQLIPAGFHKEAQMYWRLVVPFSEFEAAAHMERCQQNAIRHIRTLAKSNHERAMPKLQKRVLSLGSTEQDLFMTLSYIREFAPILIHVNLTKMINFFEKDTHYRNQFETHSSGGLLKPLVREKWEKDLFGDAYKGAKGFDRPKYGVLNAMNDHRGVVKCSQYGDSYIVLKDVRLRSTFSPEDSANLKAERLAVLDYYAHVLQEYSDKELMETIKVAKSSDAAIVGNSEMVGSMKYKETQIHGEICLSKHVERVVAAVRHRRKDGDRLQELAKKHGWSFSWMDNERERMKAQEIHKVGEEAWKKKMEKLMGDDKDEGEEPGEEVPAGFCKKRCGRPVAPGVTDKGRPFTTCCRACALGFGHSLTCGKMDPAKLGEGLCQNGCGRPVAGGTMPSGRRFVTCCRGCGVGGEHDANCGVDGGDPFSNELGKCKMGCGRPVAIDPTGKRKFVTCCKDCACGKGTHHPSCVA